jgi:hypothetical protein
MAQSAGGPGIFIRPTCTTITNPVTNKTVCFQTSDQTWRYWNGSTYAQVSIAAPGIYPNGAPPQLGGYSASNTPESETVTGAITLSRSGANAYTATTPHSACSGQWVNDISTGAVGTCAHSVVAPITPPQTATYSASTATFDATLGSEATLTISHDVTITLSGCTAGQHLFLKLKYTGSFTPTFAVGGSDTLNFNANGAPTFTATNSKTDIIGFDCQSNGSGIDYDALPASLGYSH